MPVLNPESPAPNLMATAFLGLMLCAASRR